MACKFKAPNGNPSKFFDNVYQSNGLTSAINNYKWINSDDFKSWYNNGELDVNGDPVIVNGVLINDKGEHRPLQSSDTQTPNVDVAKQAEELQQVFKNAGIDVDIKADTNSVDSGFVISNGKEIKLHYNPIKIKEDTIFHEFGHIYIDMIGYNDPLIQQGIKQVHNTELWNTIQRNYPELTGERLAKEVLTTAIGIEAAKRHSEKTKYLTASPIKNRGLFDTFDNFLFWINELFRKVADKLNFSKDVASRLAYDLTSGNLRSNLTGKVSQYKQSQKYTIENIIKESKSIQLTADEKNYQIGNNGERLDRVTSWTEKIKGVFNRSKVLSKLSQGSKNVFYKKYTNKEYQENLETLAKLWADKREEGTGIHLIPEIYIDLRNSGIERKEAKKEVLDNLYKPKKAGQKDEDGVLLYDGMNVEQVSEYIDNILNFIDDLYLAGFKLHPEVKVADEDMGLAGTIDLVAVDSTGKIHIFDFKTKENIILNGQNFSKFDEFNAVHGFMADILTDIPKNTANGYSLQLSVYKLMLERKGLKVGQLHIVPFIGEIEKTNNQFNYTNVRLYKPKDKSMSNFTSLNTFKLNDFSGRINEVLFAKDDISEHIGTIKQQEELNNEYAEMQEDTKNLKEWIKETIVDIRRSVGRVNSMSDKEIAERYQHRAENLIKRMMVADEMDAIVAYTEFIETTLFRLEKQLHNRPFKDNGVIKMKQGYINLTWKEIKNMEQNNPIEFTKFMGFLINADNFIKQFEKIRDINFSYSGEFSSASNRIIERMKRYESKISDLSFHFNSISQILDTRYLELSTNNKFDGLDIKDAYRTFIEAQQDETWMQANVDALADTHNTYMANVVKWYDYRMKQSSDEIKQHLIEWESIKKDLQGILDIVVDKEGRLLQQIDYDAYKKAEKEMWSKYNEAKVSGNKNANKMINKFFKANRELKSTEEIKQMEKQMLNKLGRDVKDKNGNLIIKGFQSWKSKQQYTSEYQGRREVRYSSSGEYYKIKNSKWSNKDYDNLTDTQKEAIKKLRNLFGVLTNHTKGGIIQNGYIPAIHKNERSAVEQILGAIGWHDNHKLSDTGLFDENGNIIYTMPFKFNSRLAGNEEETDITPDMDIDTVTRITEENKKIRKRNYDAHKANINRDLNTVVPLFIEQATKHRYKKGMEFELQRVKRSFINNHKIKLTKGGIPFKDYYRKDISEISENVERTTKDSKLLKHYENWLKMVFYEQFENDEGLVTKVARVLQNYTSFNGMAFNFLSAVNNQTYGKLMSTIEGFAGEHYSRTDWLKASNDYWTNIHHFIADANKLTGFNSKISAFVKEFNIMQDYTELAKNENADKSVASKALRGISKGLGAAYMLEHASEHNLQNRLLLAMSRSHKIVNGKIISFKEFKQGKLEIVDKWSKDVAKQKIIITKNKEKTKKLKEDFNKFPRLIDAYDFNNGQLSLTVNLEKNELAEFERKVLGINQYLHGIYTKQDAGAVQQYALGRLAIQFRKWMRPGWNKRWGTRMGESFYNERRRMEDEGIYTTTLNYIFSPVSKLRNELQHKKELGEAISTIEAIQTLIKDYGNFIIRAGIHWNSLNDSQKAAVKRTMLEWASLTSAIAILTLLKEMKGNDDEPSQLLILSIYQMDRTISELTTYVPIAFAPPTPISNVFVGGGVLNETKKILKSPTATFNSLERLFKLGKVLITYPFTTDEERLYKTGVNHGKSKVETQFSKLVPIYNQIVKWNRLEDNYNFYKLF